MARVIPCLKFTGRERYEAVFIVSRGSFYPFAFEQGQTEKYVTFNFFTSLQNNLMPNGEANVTGNVFEILHADRHSAGHYRCSADNRVGAPDTRDIFVNVLCKRKSLSLRYTTT